ncbi:hypothetical protein [uncultured Methanobrevibacter sp.]|uniref:hypothetical protein n=1 Tax=uncultured Methanobrevibacter sp. TaxID=253161 RepID=UPI0025F59E33|nr:hypothetical protein [uncultured Methanobrevibacter sp.]
MKNVEEYAQDYAQDYAEDKLNKYTEKIIINLKNKGFTINEIIETLNVSKDFVEKTLAKSLDSQKKPTSKSTKNNTQFTKNKYYQ